jgi:uncharacterized protein
MWKFLKKVERFVLYNSVRLFRIRDSSEKVARGFAVGLAVNFFPTFGFGVFISGFLARLFGGNIFAGFVGGASLAFVWPFLIYLNILTGGWMIGFFPSQIPAEVTEARIHALLVQEPSEITEAKVDALHLGKALYIGAIINSVAAAAVSYLLLLFVFRSYRTTGLVWLQKIMKRRQRKPVLPFKSASL